MTLTAAAQRRQRAAAQRQLPRLAPADHARAAAGLFAPRSIALVGASETSGWARFIVAASARSATPARCCRCTRGTRRSSDGPLSGPCAISHEPADLAFILAPTEAVATVIEDAAVGGVRNAVVLASGYREAGAGGMELEDSLIASAASHGIVLLDRTGSASSTPAPRLRPTP